MGNRLLRMVTVLSFSFAAGNAAGQIYPGEEIQGKMLVEEQAFLANMKEGLQHVQMLAVRDAMKGDYGALEEIRQSRNKAPVLPENIDIKYVASDICLFSPAGRAARKRPLLLYLHGGGWCFGSINSCARFCAALAEAGDCCVAALNYRLAPKFPFPAPLDDCRRAFEYVKCHADEWGCDSLQVSVGGDSAGGNLALATAMSVEGACKVIPIYPVTKLYTEVTPSWVEYGKGYGDDAELWRHSMRRIPEARRVIHWYPWDWPAMRHWRSCLRCLSFLPGMTFFSIRLPSSPRGSMGSGIVFLIMSSLLPLIFS